MNLTPGPAQSADLPSLEPTVSLCISDPLLFRLVRLVAIELYRNHSPVVEDEKVKPIPSLYPLDPRLHCKDDAGLPKSVIEGQFDRR